MIDLGFDFVFLSERADYQIICTRGLLPLVLIGYNTSENKESSEEFMSGHIFYRRVVVFAIEGKTISGKVWWCCHTHLVSDNAERKCKFLKSSSSIDSLTSFLHSVTYSLWFIVDKYRTLRHGNKIKDRATHQISSGTGFHVSKRLGIYCWYRQELYCKCRKRLPEHFHREYWENCECLEYFPKRLF